MVIIEQLSYWNAWTYRECVIPLYRQGFVYVQGPNGAGKSTPWDILQHTFYGTTSRGLKKKAIVCTVPDALGLAGDRTFKAEAIVRNTAGAYEGRWMVRQTQPINDSMKVEVFKEGDDGWSKKWFDSFGHEAGCPTGSTEAQKLAGKLLGLRQSEFEGCVYLSQSSSHTLIEGKPSERMKYLAYLFGIDRCDDIHAALKLQLKEIDADLFHIVGLEAQQQALIIALAEIPEAEYIEKNLGMLRDAETVAKENIQQWQQKRDDARDNLTLAKERVKIEASIAKLGDLDLSKYDALLQEKKRLDSRRDELRDAVQAAEQRDSVESKVRELSDGLDMGEALDGIIDTKQAERAKLTEQIKVCKDRDETQVALDALEPGDVAVLDERVTLLEKDLAVNRTQYQKDMAEYKDLSQLVRDASEGECPKCHHVLDLDDMKAMCSKLEDSLQVLYDEIEPQKKALAQDRAKLAEAKKADSLRQKLEGMPKGDVVDLKGRRIVLKTEITAATERRDRVQEVKSLLLQLTEMPVPIDGAEEKLSEASATLKTVSAQIDNLKSAKDLHDRLVEIQSLSVEDAETRVTFTSDTYDEMLNDSNAVSSALQGTEGQADSHATLVGEQEAIEEKLSGLEALRRRQAVLQHAVVAMPKLKRRKLHKVVCAIRDVLPRYAGTMFSHEPNTTFIVDEDEESLEFTARRMVQVGDSREFVLVPVKGFSGGEKQRLSVALVFTLHSLLDSGKKVDMLVLDEVDKALDELGIASLMALVMEIRDKYGTVIMTSHREQISGANFDKVWSVKKANEASTLRLSA